MLWRDSPDLEYATDRPGWEGLSGLASKFAYLLAPELREPAQVPPFEKLGADPAYLRATQEPSLVTILADCGLWIPGDFGFASRAATITGQPVVVTSLALLDEALDQVCLLWGKSRSEVGSDRTDQLPPDAPLDDAAHHRLAVFCRMADETRERGLPMILDY